MSRSSLVVLLLACFFVCCHSSTRIQRQALQPRQKETAIPETNVIYWEILPPTGGVRHQGCLKPVEDTRIFTNCQTEGGDEMSRATCDCAVGENKLYITCYKDGKWYPPILDTCSASSEQASVSASTDKSTSASTAGYIITSSYITLASLLISTLLY